MKTCCTVFLLSCSYVCAQAPKSSTAAAPAQSSAIKPDTVVVQMNGQPVTAAEFQRLLAVMSPQNRAVALSDPEKFFTQYAHFRKILEIAEKEHLQDQSPYKERLVEMQKQWLVNSKIDQVKDRVATDGKADRAYYDKHMDTFTARRVKAIYIPFVPGAPESDPNVETEGKARTHSLGLVQRARAGEDFVKLVAENSQDPNTRDHAGDFPVPVRPNSEQVPAILRKPILALKSGEVSDPVRVDRGFYIFKIVSVQPLPFEEVKPEIESIIRDEAAKKFLDDTKKLSSFKIENPDFIRNTAADSAAAASK